MLTAEQIIAMRMPDVTIPSGYYELAESRVPCAVPNPSQDRETIIALLALHLYTVDQQAQSGSNAAGAVTGEKEGDLSVSYSASVGVDSDLARTPWGVEASGLISAYSHHVLTRFSNAC